MGGGNGKVLFSKNRVLVWKGEMGVEIELQGGSRSGCVLIPLSSHVSWLRRHIFCIFVVNRCINITTVDVL